MSNFANGNWENVADECVSIAETVQAIDFSQVMADMGGSPTDRDRQDFATVKAIAANVSLSCASIHASFPPSTHTPPALCNPKALWVVLAAWNLLVVPSLYADEANQYVYCPDIYEAYGNRYDSRYGGYEYGPCGDDNSCKQEYCAAQGTHNMNSYGDCNFDGYSCYHDYNRDTDRFIGDAMANLFGSGVVLAMVDFPSFLEVRVYPPCTPFVPALRATAVPGLSLALAWRVLRCACRRT